MSERAVRAAGMLAAAATLAAAAMMSLDPGAPLPRATADPAPPTSPTTSAAAEFPSDDHGYLNSEARCDDGQTLMVFGRTSRSLVAVCVGPDGQLEYRGVRVSDRAGLTMAASRSSDGVIVASNDDVTYSITPQVLLVSEGDTVLYRDPWLEYHTPRSSAGSTTSPTSTAPSTSAASTPATSSPTVSTTTVTLKPGN